MSNGGVGRYLYYAVSTSRLVIFTKYVLPYFHLFIDALKVPATAMLIRNINRLNLCFDSCINRLDAVAF